MPSQEELVQFARARTQVTLSLQPAQRVVAKCDLARWRRDPSASDDIGFLGGEPRQCIALGAERLSGDMPAAVVPVRRLPATGWKFTDTAEMTTGHARHTARAIAHVARTTVLGFDFAIRRMPSELPFCGGDDGTRTHDPLRAKQVL